MVRIQQRIGGLFLGLAVLSATLFGVTFAQETAKKAAPEKKPTSYSPVVITEDFSKIMARMKSEKPSVMKRQTDLLKDRYDLSDRPAKGVLMSGTAKKPIQEGVRVKLPEGMTWEKLA